MRRSIVSSLLLLFLGSATSVSCTFADLSTSSSDEENLFFSETPTPDLEPLDFNTINPPPLTEEIFSDSYGSIGDLLASDPSECSGFLPLGGIGARSNFCSEKQDPSSSNGEAQPSTDRILSAEDVENYWCSGSPRKLDLANVPVCELELYADDRFPVLPTEGGFVGVIFGNLCLLSLFLFFNSVPAMNPSEGKKHIVGKFFSKQKQQQNRKKKTLMFRSLVTPFDPFNCAAKRIWCCGSYLPIVRTCLF